MVTAVGRHKRYAITHFFNCMLLLLSFPSLSFSLLFPLVLGFKIGLAWSRNYSSFFFLFRALEDCVLNCFLDAAIIHKSSYRIRTGLILVQNSITCTSGLCGSQNSSECKSTCALAVAPILICCFCSLNANILQCILV